MSAVILYTCQGREKMAHLLRNDIVCWVTEKKNPTHLELGHFLLFLGKGRNLRRQNKVIRKKLWEKRNIFVQTGKRCPFPQADAATHILAGKSVGWVPATTRLRKKDVHVHGPASAAVPSYPHTPRGSSGVHLHPGKGEAVNVLVKSGLWWHFVSKPDIAIYFLSICYILALLLYMFNHGEVN